MNAGSEQLFSLFFLIKGVDPLFDHASNYYSEHADKYCDIHLIFFIFFISCNSDVNILLFLLFSGQLLLSFFCLFYLRSI
jgi:hypothetical protein